MWVCVCVCVRVCIVLNLLKKNSNNQGNVHVKNPKILALLPCPPFEKFFLLFLNQINHRKSASE